LGFPSPVTFLLDPLPVPLDPSPVTFLLDPLPVALFPLPPDPDPLDPVTFLLDPLVPVPLDPSPVTFLLDPLVPVPLFPLPPDPDPLDPVTFLRDPLVPVPLDPSPPVDFVPLDPVTFLLDPPVPFVPSPPDLVPLEPVTFLFDPPPFLEDFLEDFLDLFFLSSLDDEELECSFSSLNFFCLTKIHSAILNIFSILILVPGVLPFPFSSLILSLKLFSYFAISLLLMGICHGATQSGRVDINCNSLLVD